MPNPTSSVSASRGGDGGRGGGVYFPDPPRIFTGADLAACRTARNTHFSDAANADELASYQRDQYLGILLKPAAGNSVTETYLPGEASNAYDATKWVDRGNVASDAAIDARIAAPARANNPSGTFADSRLPATIARDAELHRSHFVWGLAYNNADTKFVAGMISPVAETITSGDIIVFLTPTPVPLGAAQAVVSIPVGGVNVDYALIDTALADFSLSDLSPGTLYWGFAYAGSKIRLLNATAGEGLTRRASRTITNAELKTLDTDYIELAPAPGAGKYISVSSVVFNKSGDDNPRPYREFTKMWSAASGVAAAADGNAADNNYSGNRVLLENWEGEDRYVFLAVAKTMKAPTEIAFDRAGNTNWDFASNFTMVAAGITLTATAAEDVGFTGDVECDLWRSNDQYMSSVAFLEVGNPDGNWGAAFNASLWLLSGGGELFVGTAPSFISVLRDMRVGIGSVVDTAATKPLYAQFETFGRIYGSREFSPVYGVPLNDLLRVSGAVNAARSIGESELISNAPLALGAFEYDSRPQPGDPASYYDYHADRWDDYLQGVDDVTFEITVQYAIHSG